MKKSPRKSAAADEMRPHYDFSKGVRGKYAGRPARTAIVVVLDSDVAKVFKTSDAVNSALRALVAIVKPKKSKSAS
jgi:hypothetical protein